MLANQRLFCQADRRTETRMDQSRMLTRTQASLLEQCQRLSRMFGTPNTIPTRAAIVLCSYHFRCPPINALRELKRAGYVDFDGESGNLRVRELPIPARVIENTPQPIPLPRGDHSLRLLRDAFERYAGSPAYITRATLGRANAADNALEDDEIVPRRKKPETKSGSSRR